jgi:hypothetical protein
MATTALKVGDVKIKFMTLPGELLPALVAGKEPKAFLNIEVRQCDENFMPTGNCSISISELDEETYHKNLRIEAQAKGHFVPEESTDYQWHPDYKAEEDVEHLDVTEDDSNTI